MFRSSVAIFTISALIFPISLAGSPLGSAPCSSPFAAYPGDFKLVEKLSCNSLTSPVRLDINLKDTGWAGYLTAECDKNSPYFTMYLGETEMVKVSDPLANALSTLVRISDTCDGTPLFLIDRQPALYTLPNKTKVNTSMRVFAQDNAQTLIAYVTATEDTTNGLVLRAADETVLATAKKKFFSGSTCSAEWTVSNPGKTEQISSVMAILLSLKDNPEMSCLPQPSCPSQAGSFFAGAGIGGALVGAVLTGVFFYVKYKFPTYMKLTE